MLNRWWPVLHRKPGVWVAVGIVVGHASLMAGVAAAGRWGDYAFASLDATEYYQLAQSLSDHFAFGVAGPSGGWSANTWRTPGYPAFLALVMTLVGRSPAALIAVQHLLGMLSTWLIFSIARRHMSTRRAGLVTLLFFLEPYHHYYSFWLLSTSLFVALLLVTWYAWGASHGDGDVATCLSMEPVRRPVGVGTADRVVRAGVPGGWVDGWSAPR